MKSMNRNFPKYKKQQQRAEVEKKLHQQQESVTMKTTSLLHEKLLYAAIPESVKTWFLCSEKIFPHKY